MKTTTMIKDKDGIRWLGRTLDSLVSVLSNGKYRVVIERYTEPRTLSQNALMWFWMTCIEESTGTAKEDVYNYYCRKFLSRITVVAGHEVLVNDTSSMLNTVQMSEFMTKIQADAASEMGIVLPLPSDRYYEEFINDYKR